MNDRTEYSINKTSYPSRIADPDDNFWATMITTVF